VNPDCQVADPSMGGYKTEFQEVTGNVYGCNHEECKQYFPEENIWKTIPETKFVSEREFAAGTLFEDKWVVQGGNAYDADSDDYIDLETTEVWTPGSEGEWEEYPDFKSPMAVSQHCFLTLNNKLMQIGGMASLVYTRKCFLDGAEVASLNSPRTNHACAVFQGQVWVAGGNSEGGDQDVVEIYDPDTDTWRDDGPKLPTESSEVIDYYPRLAEHNDQLYYIGGIKIGKIYKLSQNKDAWEEAADIEKGSKYAAIVMKKPPC